MKRVIYYTWAFVSLFFVACVSSEVKENKAEATSSEGEKTITTVDAPKDVPSMGKNGLKLYPVPVEVEYRSAGLNLKSPSELQVQNEGPTMFNFELTEYELKDQTAAEKAKQIANSAKGQHIHFIVNNAPYQAKYEPQFEAELLEGNNVVLAFLSKSFHESVKNEKAFYFHNFYVGEGENEFNESAPHLFYSRPKGEYKADKTKQILVDFYLVNTTLSEGGNRVRLSIDETEFMLTSWQAYFVEGLAVGKHSFRIQLLDAEGNAVAGPFNDSGTRTITIVE